MRGGRWKKCDWLNWGAEAPGGKKFELERTEALANHKNGSPRKYIQTHGENDWLIRLAAGD